MALIYINVVKQCMFTDVIQIGNIGAVIWWYGSYKENYRHRHKETSSSTSNSSLGFYEDVRISWVQDCITNQLLCDRDGLIH